MYSDLPLGNRQTVHFVKEQEGQAVAQVRAGRKLTDWFKAIRTEADARHLRYVDFPQYFAW